ncbi:hypothetical protein RQP46_000513 [Phenoliferia psychrophenolica]
MLKSAAIILTALAATAVASPIAASNAGATTSDVFPPPSATVNSVLFPDESQLGYPGITVSNLSPQYSVDSAVYGLPGASPAVPEHCEAVQVHYYYRHGARYPTTGAAPSAFAAKVHNATQTNASFAATGPLSFLNSWTYALGAELLTPFGRQQNFDLGVGARVAYGGLLNNFTAAGKLPVFRTESQDRMVKTAINFASGFFGVPEATAFLPAIARLNSWITGINFTATDIGAMLQLCAYETDALGYSKFCELFTEEDFEAFEYGYDLSTVIPVYDSTTNSTLDGSNITFPLDQSFYADAAHEVSILDAMTAINLTALAPTPLSPTTDSRNHTFVASRVVPFATNLVIQVLECQSSAPTKQIRSVS